MMIIKPPDDTEQSQRGLPAMIGPGGYANPSTPIRVALARDEEAAGIENDATKLPPPAYGLWRESVVCISSSVVSMALILTISRELTPTVYSGSATKQPIWNVTIQDQNLVQQLPIDLHPTYPTME